MDKALRRIGIGMLAALLTLPCGAQILAPILYGHAAAGPSSSTNIAYVGDSYAFHSATTSMTNAYTCFSTADNLVVIGQSGATSGTAVFTLTNTGSQTSNVVVGASAYSSGSVGSDTIEVWISGCAAGSNTYTLSQTTSTAMVLTLVEYSGLSLASTGSFTDNTGTVAPFSGSITASSPCMLAIAYVSEGTSTTVYKSTSAGFSWRTRTANNSTSPNNQDVFDNICAPSGSVNFTTDDGSGSSRWSAGMILISGASATSPGWNPSLRSSQAAGGASCAFLGNVASGDLGIVAFQSEASPTITGVTDSLSTAYTLQKHLQTTSGVGVWIYTGIFPSGGADTVTVAGSGFSFDTTYCNEFAGSGQTVSDTGGVNVTSGTMAWTQAVSTANSVVYAFCGGFHSSTTFSTTMAGINLSRYSNASDAGANWWLRTTSTASLSFSVALNTTDGNVCASVVLQ